MTASAKADVGAEERAEIFHATFDVSIDAGATLAQIVRSMGDYLATIVGDEVADAAMAKVIVPLAGEEPSRADWRGALDENESGCFSEWHLGQRLHNLAAYAYFGIALAPDEDPAEVERWLDSIVSEARRFREMSPLELWLGRNRAPQLERLIMLAEARWALDHGDPVDPVALAQFGGISEGRMRNMMGGANRAFTPDETKKIPAHEAVAWLVARESFWNSIWREQRLPRYAQSRSGLTDPVFVPVARDGSVFHPGLLRGGSYTIGEKGDERHLADWREALVELQRLPVPAWRRPNEAGTWGLVTGIRWERLDRDDLDLFAADPRHRLKGATQ